MGVNLLSPTYNPVAQAQRWFNLFTEDDIALFQRNQKINFVDVIELISKRCNERNQTLVIRDWTHLDFTGVPFLSTISYRLTTAEVLNERFEVMPITTVRHPIDQWLSLTVVPIIRDRLLLKNFLHGYRLFAEHCVRIGFIRYEDFVRSPQTKMHEICDRLNIEYDHGFLDRWSSYSKITGDVGPVSLNRLEIKVLGRKPVDPNLVRQFELNTDYQTSLRLLGYSHPV